MAGKKVLVVDDEKLIVKGIRFSLEQDNMEVDCAYDGEEALQMAHNKEYDIILLDVMLPKLTGFEVCQQIREFSNVPVIMLTAKGDDMDKILGLEYGADDYITKPFAAEELVARMETVLRRTGRGGRELCAYDVVLDTVNHTARRNGEPVELRRLEYDLLELLMRNRGAALYRDVMYERVWGGIPDTESLRTVDTHIARLRKKLGWMDKIETVYKIGYRLKKED